MSDTNVIKPVYRVAKIYGHNLGLSSAFRQPRAKSHCRFIHGYALQVQLMFVCETLDENGWVQDYGSLKPVKAWLETTFDHKTLIAEDDPHLAYFQQGHELGVLDLLVVSKVGCESFARMVFDWVESWLDEQQGDSGHRPRLESVVISEHGANNASYNLQ